MNVFYLLLVLLFLNGVYLTESQITAAQIKTTIAPYFLTPTPGFTRRWIGGPTKTAEQENATLGVVIDNFTLATPNVKAVTVNPIQADIFWSTECKVRKVTGTKNEIVTIVNRDSACPCIVGLVQKPRALTMLLRSTSSSGGGVGVLMADPGMCACRVWYLDLLTSKVVSYLGGADKGSCGMRFNNILRTEVLMSTPNDVHVNQNTMTNPVSVVYVADPDGGAITRMNVNTQIVTIYIGMPGVCSVTSYRNRILFLSQGRSTWVMVAFVAGIPLPWSIGNGLNNVAFVHADCRRRVVYVSESAVDAESVLKYALIYSPHRMVVLAGINSKTSSAPVVYSGPGPILSSTYSISEVGKPSPFAQVVLVPSTKYSEIVLVGVPAGANGVIEACTSITTSVSSSSGGTDTKYVGSEERRWSKTPKMTKASYTHQPSPSRTRSRPAATIQDREPTTTHSSSGTITKNTETETMSHLHSASRSISCCPTETFSHPTLSSTASWYPDPPPPDIDDSIPTVGSSIAIIAHSITSVLFFISVPEVTQTNQMALLINRGVCSGKVANDISNAPANQVMLSPLYMQEWRTIDDNALLSRSEDGRVLGNLVLMVLLCLVHWSLWWYKIKRGGATLGWNNPDAKFLWPNASLHIVSVLMLEVWYSSLRTLVSYLSVDNTNIQTPSLILSIVGVLIVIAIVAFFTFFVSVCTTKLHFRFYPDTDENGGCEDPTKQQQQLLPRDRPIGTWGNTLIQRRFGTFHHLIGEYFGGQPSRLAKWTVLRHGLMLC
eukprot:PhF_6_TR11710/c0_g1_i2/m.19056